MLYSRHWIIAARPPSMWERAIGKTFDYGVQNNAVAVLADQRRVCIEFAENMVVRMVRIEDYQNFAIRRGKLADSGHRFGRNRRPFNSFDLLAQRMASDPVSVMPPDTD